MRQTMTVYYTFPDFNYFDFPYDIFLPENYLEKKFAEEFGVNITDARTIMGELELHNQVSRRYYDEIKEEFYNDAWKYCLKEFEKK